MMENKKMYIKRIFKAVFVLFILLLAFVFYSFTPTDFEYTEPQPNFLVRLTENNTDNSLGIILEADTSVRCVNNYELRSKFVGTENASAVFEIDGLYNRPEKPWKFTSCTPRGPKRPLAQLKVSQSEIETIEGISFIFKEDVDKYSIIRNDEGSITLEPKKGGFTEIKTN